MKRYLVDTNFWLRFLLEDVEAQRAKVQQYMFKAQHGKIALVLFADVVMEMVFVLTKQYEQPRKEVAGVLGKLLKVEHLEIPEREALIAAMKLFGETKLDFVDLLLFSRAQNEGAELLTFDRELAQFSGAE